MSDNNQHRVNFALVKVITEQIELSEEQVIEDNRQVKINAGLNFGIDSEKKLIKVLFKNSFETEEAPFITIETGCIFAVDPESWTMFARQEENMFVIPKNFAGHLASITTHTTRGILHHATENTPLNRFLIPANNIEEMIKEHVTLPLQRESA